MLAPAMKVAVCVKEVPDAAAPKRIDPETFRLDRSGAAALNDFDTQALEEGLRLKEKGGAEELVALLMGPARAADSLRKALAMGADRSMLITDDAFAGYDVIEAPLPCVVAVSDAINEPRYPSLKGIMGAKKKPQETLGAGDLGVTPEEAGESGSRTEVYALGEPPSRGESEKIEDD